MKIHLIDIHPDPALDDESRPHTKKAFDENRVSLCGSLLPTSEQMTSNLEMVGCTECRHRGVMLQRHADDSLTHRILGEIRDELQYHGEYDTLEGSYRTAEVAQLAEGLMRVFHAHMEIHGEDE